MPAYRAAKAELAERTSGRCEARLEGCTGQGQDTHHVKARGRGGPLLPEDGQQLLYTCRNCHSAIHASPRQARERGLLK
mgnify:CR=1 FL=1